jgi:hypothetical protein
MAEGNNNLVTGKKRRRGRPEIKWEKEVERLIKQKNLTPDEAKKRQIWRKATDMQ